MSFNFFLYRRLARWITCELKLENDFRIKLQNKYEVASFKDVFCHPFYWQIFHLITEPPKLVIDCGAHCGHFTMLAERCCRSKFDTSKAEYILIEPNPYLQPVIRKNLADTNLSDRAQLFPALLGSQTGTGTLWIDRRNFLTASTAGDRHSAACQVPYLNLAEIVGDRQIDLLKLDIEGGEFDFVGANLELFSRVNLLFMEVHQAPPAVQSQLFKSLEMAGLNLIYDPVSYCGQQLAIWQRGVPANRKFQPVACEH